ncbi:MAG: hypothetical protein ACTTKD_04145 [Peptoanaerobacter stomatis]|uniref:hypothetical protein n=1 Tax=Peptoanaerobacter stomatis TaxID=796937 RepID=UPI003F9F1A0B
MIYKGFYINEMLGNNSFSYNMRKNKSIYVPPLIEVYANKNNLLNELKLSDKVAFSEIDENKEEMNVFGLKNFLHIGRNGKHIYIFDNHNHCFYFVAYTIFEKLKKMLDEENYIEFINSYINKNEKITYLTEKIAQYNLKNMMIHFDQHKDMRVPKYSLQEFLNVFLLNEYDCLEKYRLDIERNFKNISNFVENISLNENYDISKNDDTLFKNIIDDIFSYYDKITFLYTNYHLNVGNFIVPLINGGFIEDITIVDSLYSIDNISKELYNYNSIVLDIDLDFFSKDMDYIDDELKIDAIAKCYERADVVTICTSPYFIEFERAEKYLYKILERFDIF